MPMLPLDIMGRTVGEAEDNIVSLFSYCFLQHRKTILILDNLENLVESKENQSSVSTGDKAFLHRGAPQSHSIARTESTFLSLLDKIHQLHHVRQNRLLVICTVANDVSITMGRFDRVFHLSYPSSKERKLLVTSEIGIKNHDDDRSVKSLLSDVVEITLGMSFAEISHCCREALQNAYNSTIPAPEDNAMAPENVLNQLKRSLQSRIPESLRHGVNDDFVDISVITARELVHGTGRGSDGGSPALPLVGHQAVAAWKEMEKLILFPLCRSEALNSLIFGEGKSKAISRKVFLGGVLLTGPPGSGKSALSYHCATVAASILPTVKLIDVSCTSLIHKEVGGSERAVHKLFEIAKSAAPCILVMDGLENVATVRGNDMTTEGTMDRVLSTLLTELDGVDNDNLSYESGGGIVIIGITHDPKWIDPALRRPGRIEKEISLTYPDKKAATAIIHKELSREIGVFSNSTDYRVSDDLIDFLATNVEGMSGAAIISVCDQAKIICARRHLERPGHDIAISRQDFIEALGFEYK
jgi:SpoVK/Ycf46/Vps4 family AAA+-type ATPase